MLLWDTPSINSSNIKISGFFSKFESRICTQQGVAISVLGIAQVTA
jgi:hypothetical protein